MSKRRVAAVLALILMDEKKARKKRSCWVRAWLARRNKLGCHENLLKEFMLEDEESFRRYLRMDKATYSELLNLVGPLITKKDTRWRKAISPSQKLSITLRHLATGESQWSLSTQFRVAQSTISKFIVDVCMAIFEALNDRHLKVPANPSEWRNVAEGFEKTWNFVHCIGAIDGKHVAIKCPPKSGSMYYNYKGFHSIVMMAIFQSDLRFLYVDVGTPGRMSDGGTWGKCSLNKHLENNTLGLPPYEQIPLIPTPMPYTFVADEAFPLKENIMRPFPGSSLDCEKRIFNYRLSRARRISENGFGVMANTWRILHSTIDMNPDRIEHFLLAICALHNFLLDRKTTRNMILPPGMTDVEDINTGTVILGDWRNNGLLTRLQRLTPHGYQKGAITIRNEFKSYFNGGGSVPWQNKFALK